MNNNEIPPEVLEKIFKDRLVRKEVTSNSFFWFIYTYFGSYLTYPTAPFHHEMFKLVGDDSLELLVLQAFRGSGKTTLINQFYPIWAILGKQQLKHVVILSQTMPQAKMILKNIKTEFESNELLKNDMGPFEEDEEWNSYSLVIPEYGARITAASSEQSIRGIKHGKYRPELAILDDVEDINSVKTRESRDNTYRWVTGDILGLGDKRMRVIVIGNFLHEDSLLMRLINEIKLGERSGVYRTYPLLDENENIAWPGKYSSMEEVLKHKKLIGNERAWRREFLLQIVPEDDQLVYREHIHYYDKLPDPSKIRAILIGVDLAISLKTTADYTAITSAIVEGYGANMKIYILPNPVNKRMDFRTTLETIKKLYYKYRELGHVEIIIEKNQYQQSAAEQLKYEGIPNVRSVMTQTDKRSRVASSTDYIQIGKFLFSKVGNEIILDQLVNFSTTKHDDLVDSFTLIFNRAVELNKPGPSIRYITIRKNNWSGLNEKDESGLTAFERGL